MGQTGLNYTGQRLDGTGLLYYHARMYDPVLARFVSADSVVPGASAMTMGPDKASNGPADPQQLNRYTYGLNNPINKKDPTGHTSIACPECHGGGGGGTLPQSPNASSNTGTGLGDALAGAITAAAITVYNFITGEDDTSATENNEHVPWHTTANAKGKDKVQKQMGKRGWTPQEVQDTLDNPVDTAPGRDTRADPETGEKIDQGPVTYYYNKDGHYVVRRDDTGEIIQVSDRNDPDWIDSRTDKPIYPRG